MMEGEYWVRWKLLISAPHLIHTCVSSLTDDSYQWILILNSVSEVMFLHCSLITPCSQLHIVQLFDM